MSLKFLFRGNALICFQMASTAKTVDLKHEWLELAKNWKQKADCDDQINGGAVRSPQTHVEPIAQRPVLSQPSL
jgi:hypothetical protein